MSQIQKQFSKNLLLQWQSVTQHNTEFSFYCSSSPTDLYHYACSFSQHTQAAIKFIRLLPSSAYTPYGFIFSLLNKELEKSPYSLQNVISKATQYKPLQKMLLAILQKQQYKRPEIFITDYLFFEKKAFTDAIIKLVEILITTPTAVAISGWHYACASDIELLKILATHNISAPLLVLISIDTQHALTNRQDDEEWESFLDWLDDSYLLHKIPEFKEEPLTGCQIESQQSLDLELVEKNIVMMAWPEAISLIRFLLEKTAVSEQLKQTLLLKLSEALLFDGQLDSALNELDMLQIFSEQLASPEEKIHLLNLLSLTLTRRQNFDDAILHAELAYQAAQQANNERLIIQSLFINFFAHHKSSSPMPLHEFDRLDLNLQLHNMDCSRLYLLRNYYTYLRFYDELDPHIAIDITHLAMMIARDMGHKQGIAASYHSKGIIYSYCNRFHAANKCFAVSSRIHSLIGDQNACLKIHNGKGYFNNLRGQYKDAQKEYLEAFNIASQIDNDSELIITLFNFAWLYFCTNDYQHAIGILDQIVRICRIRQITHFPFRNLYDVLSLKGYCHAKLEQLTNAEQCLERMQGLPFKPSRTAEFLHALLQGSLYRAKNQFKQACEIFEQAPAILGKIIDLDTCLLPKCNIELIEIYSRQGDWKKCHSLIDNSLLLSEAMSLPRYNTIFKEIQQRALQKQRIYSHNITFIPLPESDLQLNKIVRSAKQLTQLRQAQQHLSEIQLINRMYCLPEHFDSGQELTGEALKLICGKFNIQLGLIHHLDGSNWHLWNQFGESSELTDVNYCLKQIFNAKKPFLENYFHSQGEYGTRSTYDFIANFPIFVDGHLFAAMTLKCVNINRYLNQQNKNTLSMICCQLGNQIQHLRHRENLIKMSQTDPLTGLFNRQALLSRLQQELLLHVENDSSQQCSLAYVDLDNFKLINDQLGHDVGDKVITAFSELLSDTIRTIDIVARWGGDEFVIVFPNVNKMQAEIVAQRILLSLQKRLFFKPLLCEWSNNPAVVETLPNLTCSIGIADCSGISYEKLNEEWLLKQADSALYIAKSEGKGRIKVRSEHIHQV